MWKFWFCLGVLYTGFGIFVMWTSASRLKETMDREERREQFKLHNGGKPCDNSNNGHAAS